MIRRPLNSGLKAQVLSGVKTTTIRPSASVRICGGKKVSGLKRKWMQDAVDEAISAYEKWQANGEG